MQYIYAQGSDAGTVKKINQDSLYLVDAVAHGRQMIFCAVCDGVGGLSHGEFASAKMVRLLASWSREVLPSLFDKSGIKLEETADALKSLIKEANGKILAHSRAEGNKEGSGTTICALLLYEGIYLTVNVGDSRAYKITDDGFMQLTRDQTLLQDRIDSGWIKKEEAKKVNYRHVITQCIGAAETVVPVVTHGTYGKGDIFAVCSDGFYGMIDDQIRDLVVPEFNQKESDLLVTCSRCISMVKKRKERDNITAVLIKALGEAND